MCYLIRTRAACGDDIRRVCTMFDGPWETDRLALTRLELPETGDGTEFVIADCRSKWNRSSVLNREPIAERGTGTISDSSRRLAERPALAITEITGHFLTNR